jgi:RNA polymerase sigma-70 factor (ECF subfamily)
MSRPRQTCDGGSAAAVTLPCPAEARLISACIAGDREAFRRLFDLHRDRLYTIALYHLGGDRDAAEDVVQTVFVKLFRCISQFRSDSEFSTWLYRMTTNACLDEHRRRKKWLPWAMVPDAGHYSDISGVDESVRAAIDRLSPKLRMPILLKYFEEMSYGEIAGALGCSMGTVASRLNRAHKILAQHLSHLEEEAGG